jgi:large subunit ribosomal protein L25
MMERTRLEAKSRELRGKKVKQLRAQHWIPAVIYGPDMPPEPIQIQETLLRKTLQEAGSTALIDLAVAGNKAPYVVLARDIQRDILNGRVQHVDFYQVRLTETVKTTPRLIFEGESAVVKGGFGVVIHAMNEIEVECLPTALISSITVDLSALETLDDTITVADLNVPSDVTILLDPEETVASAVPLRVAEVEEVEEVEEGELILGEVVAEPDDEEADPEA